MNTNEQNVQTAVPPEPPLQSAAQTGEPEVPTFRRTIGGTTYIVRVYFSKTSKETMADKVKKMLINDISLGATNNDKGTWYNVCCTRSSL